MFLWEGLTGCLLLDKGDRDAYDAEDEEQQEYPDAGLYERLAPRTFRARLDFWTHDDCAFSPAAPAHKRSKL